ncbi:MAG: NAD(P)H-binding protein [Thermoproteota archaeon]|nr:NAD(P)H-binding protein [Thermoproteota archaeon]
MVYTNQHSFTRIEKIGGVKILITGINGFIGNRLLKRLLEIQERLDSPYKIRCLSRKGKLNIMADKMKGIETVKGDLSNYNDCLKALENIDIAYYLVHSMEGSSKDWKKFSEREKTVAENFMRAASVCKVKRIIYLGGLSSGKDNELSQHMYSRKVVGEILKKSTAKVTIFRASVILGSGGSSFEMIRYLVERLPVMVCPKWVLTKCQPIFVNDVINYLTEAINVKETEGKTFDIGGPDTLTYMHMMKIYAKTLGKTIRIIIIPFLTPRLSSYWVDLVTPIKASLARPLIDSLRHESVVRDNSVRELIPIELKPFKEALEYCLNEERVTDKKNSNKNVKERTSFSTNYKILLLSLIMLLAIGTTYYFLDERKEFLQPFWLSVAVLWYISILFSIYFIRYGARLGALVAGVVAWGSLFFWLLDNYYLVSGHSLLFSNPNQSETLRDFAGVVISAFTIITSHNIFHKIRFHI